MKLMNTGETVCLYNHNSKSILLKIWHSDSLKFKDILAIISDVY